jgi:hypothetical protein
MSFITLDDKDWCKGIYSNGKIFYNRFPANLDKTWKYNPSFDDGNVLFAHLWADGKSIEQICPDHLKNRLSIGNKKLDAFYRSFVESKINLNDNCFFDLVPEHFLLEYCEIKSQIVASVFENHKKPENYFFYLTLEKLIAKIRSRDLNLDLKSNTNKILKKKEFIRSIKNHTKNISYNQFGTKTGRLTTQPNSFPILTMNSDYRSIVKPTNDHFIELDYNAAEARTLLALSGKEQPKEDIHEWNSKKLNITRDEAKKGLFAWLYGSRKPEYDRFSELFDIKAVLDKYYDGKYVQNPYGRKIEADPFHALNYLVQSTTADLVLRQILKIDSYLDKRKSFVSFIIHDAVFLDVTNDESEIIRDIYSIFASNDLAVFPVNLSRGQDFGSMLKIC